MSGEPPGAEHRARGWRFGARSAAAPRGPSLRGRVARWLVPSMLALLLVNAWTAQRTARQTVDRAWDRGLVSSAHLIADRTYSQHGEVVVDLPYAALDILGDDSKERVFYGVFWPDGDAITGYDDLPRPAPSAAAQVSYDASYRGEPLRAVAMRKRLYDPEQRDASSVIVIVAETVEGRDEVARELFLDNLRSQGLLLAGGLLVIWLTLGTAFRPLTRLGAAFAARRDDDLTPVATAGIPSELAPLIVAVNHHMQRIGAMMLARRRFVADAAHQLRTPLAVLRTQIDYGLRQHDPAEMRRALDGLGHSVRHTQRLTNQLLALSRAEAVNGLSNERAPVDLTALARDVAADLSLLAIERGIDLGYDADALDAAPRSTRLVMGNEPMLRELVMNLVDNALRYTPRGGSVTVAVLPASLPAPAVDGAGASPLAGAAAGAPALELRVTDTGPGIPPAERERVFHRFYRILRDGQGEGSGLGLAIVREIAQAHGSEAVLGDGPGGQGLAVSVVLARVLS
ncbi:sensor histidine kinase [Derxia gummosa]|uniref:histidine kinase n=1 Tax=Derxia gummosa DSM 723 TaxID=1121388 RepID=A0A8B6XBQ4_9BURK|nr:sensor histidine kinase [Derxia gummosa]